MTVTPKSVFAPRSSALLPCTLTDFSMRQFSGIYPIVLRPKSTRTLSSLGLDIASARIATEIDQAYDTFYVHDRHGHQLEHLYAMDRAREGLEQALVQPL